MEPDTIFGLKQAAIARKLIAQLKNEPTNLRDLLSICNLGIEDVEILELSLQELIQAGIVRVTEIDRRRYYFLNQSKSPDCDFYPHSPWCEWPPGYPNKLPTT
jgi:hypothetical protein